MCFAKEKADVQVGSVGIAPLLLIILLINAYRGLLQSADVSHAEVVGGDLGRQMDIIWMNHLTYHASEILGNNLRVITPENESCHHELLHRSTALRQQPSHRRGFVYIPLNIFNSQPGKSNILPLFQAECVILFENLRTTASNINESS